MNVFFSNVMGFFMKITKSIFPLITLIIALTLCLKVFSSTEVISVLVNEDEQMTVAGNAIVQSSNAKLDMIIKQIEFLKNQAEKVISDARHNVMLHQAKCTFDRKPGQTYHLYKKNDGTMQWSILSLEDWMGSPPWEYIGSYQLMGDQTWKDISDPEPEQSIDFSNLILRKEE